jgi:hypothetical protein
MALAPADFAAYSRATGTPYPEDPEDRAALAPAVRDFRQSQLRQQESGSPVGALAGLAAVGLGALGLGLAARRGFGAKAAGGGRKGGITLADLSDPRNAAVLQVANQATKSEPPVKTTSTDLVNYRFQQNLADIPEPTQQELNKITKSQFDRAYNEITKLPLPRTTVDPNTGREVILDPFGVDPSSRQAVYASTAVKPQSQLRKVYKPQSGIPVELITDPNTGEIFRRGKSPSTFAQTYISPSVDLVNTEEPVEFLLNDPELKQLVAQQRRQEGAELGREAQRQMRVASAIETEADEYIAQLRQESLSQQTLGALESGEDQMTGRTMMGVQRNEDLDVSQVNAVARQTGSADVAASMTPDGVPVDQAENLTVRGLVSQGKPVLDVRQGQAVSISPRTLGQEEGETDIFREAQQYLRGREVDTDFDYSAENRAQTAQVRDRIQRAQALQSQADQIISELRGETQPRKQQLSSEDFAKQFNKQYREEVNPELKMVDNARQRAELLASRAESTGQDLESLLLGESSPVDENMRGGALRGGKINAAGDIVYQDEAGAFASADTGLKTRQAQGQQFEERARRLNQLRSASDEDLTYLVAQGQQSLANKEPLSRLDVDTYRFASQVLRDRAINNPEPTPLQLDALDRARASVAASQQALQSARNQRPTLAPGPQQDVARSMETLRRGMAVEPSEPLPVIPSVQELRTGYVSDELGDIGPIVSAPDVYTGAAAEAAGPVIFTGKSKANTVLATPPITGSIRTSTGRYLTQDNPDVLGTVYNVAGTPANRAISAQVEQNAQDFLQDAIAGGLQQKAVRVEEPYRTPGTYGVQQLNLLTPPLTEKGLSQNQLGLTGLEASQRTGYAQYQPGRSRPAPISPFTGEMAGGTVVVVPPTGTTPGTRRDIGAPSTSIDLTRRGEKSRYFPRYPEEQFVTGMEPAPIGPVLQSPGLSRIGGMTQQTVQGAGGIPITQLTPQGQKISYPRMDKPVTVPGYGTSVVTNVPRYGINPGAEDWRDDLMRSAFRRGGPIRTYQG